MANHDSMVESSSLTFGPLKQQNESEVSYELEFKISSFLSLISQISSTLLKILK